MKYLHNVNEQRGMQCTARALDVEQALGRGKVVLAECGVQPRARRSKILWMNMCGCCNAAVVLECCEGAHWYSSGCGETGS